MLTNEDGHPVTEEAVKGHMHDDLGVSSAYFTDSDGVNCTLLGESAASFFKLYGPPPTYEIPQEVWDLAVIVAEEWERENWGSC